jgi:hypothetical protein
MSHRNIRRIAISLTVFFVLVALGFAWSASTRDAALEARLAAAVSAASGPSAPGGGGAASSGGGAAPGAAGMKSFEKRCARCHEPEHVTAWVSKQPGDQCEALHEFLRQHRKAPEEENRGIAALFAPGCPGAARVPQ